MRLARITSAKPSASEANATRCTVAASTVAPSTSRSGRRGSQGGAARLLRVAHTTVGRRIAALEGALGARLFDRTPVGIVLKRVLGTTMIRYFIG